MTNAPSLRHRLAIWIGGGVAAAWLAAALWSLLALSASIDRDFDQGLKAAAERLMPLAMVQIFERDDDGTAQIIAQFDATSTSPRLAYAVQDGSGRVLLASRGYVAETLPPPGTTGWSDHDGLRRYSLTALGGQMTITVLEPLAARRSALWSASLRLLLPVALVLPLCLLLITAVLRRELGAVARLNDQIAQRGRGDLTPLENAGVARELSGVAEAVNALLDRLGQALKAERRFAANAAHELRTPIAAALAQAQRLQQEAADPGDAMRATAIAESLARLARLSEKLLQLSRAEGGAVRATENQDLTPVVRLVIDELSRANKGDLISLALPETSVRAAINPDAYAILLRNLVENAQRHGTPGTSITVNVGPDGTLRVGNDADPIDPDTLSKLKEPFQRGPTDSEGSGLGLSIARAIALAAGGQLTLISPSPGSDRGPDRGFVAEFHPRTDR